MHHTMDIQVPIILLDLVMNMMDDMTHDIDQDDMIQDTLIKGQQTPTHYSDNQPHIQMYKHRK